MSDSRDELRTWIQGVARLSEPIAIDRVMRDAPSVIEVAGPDISNIEDLPSFTEYQEERRMNGKRTTLLVVVAAMIAVVLALTIVLTNGPAGDAVDTSLTDPAEPNPQPEQGTVTVPVASATNVEVAVAFWEAVSAYDVDATLALVDPAEVDSLDVLPFGYAENITDLIDWYEAVEWHWEVGECVDPDADGLVICTVSGSNAWTEALEVDAVTAPFLVMVGEAGIQAVTDQDDLFIAQWSPNALEPFQNFVSENYLSDGDKVWGPNPVPFEEAVEVFRINTARFVEAQAIEE